MSSSNADCQVSSSNSDCEVPLVMLTVKCFVSGNANCQVFLVMLTVKCPLVMLTVK